MYKFGITADSIELIKFDALIKHLSKCDIQHSYSLVYYTSIRDLNGYNIFKFDKLVYNKLSMKIIAYGYKAYELVASVKDKEVYYLDSGDFYNIGLAEDEATEEKFVVVKFISNNLEIRIYGTGTKHDPVEYTFN